MFGSSILEVAMGVAFVYLLLSLICSAINEVIASTINKRGENLFEGIANLLNDPTFSGLAQKVYNHGLVDGISRTSKDPKKPDRRPSYMASKTFALTLMDILGSDCVSDSWQDLAGRRKVIRDRAKASLDVHPEDPEFQKMFTDAENAFVQAEEILTKIDAVKQAYEESEFAARNVKGPKDYVNIRVAKQKLEKALTLARVLAVEFPDPLGNIQKAVTKLPDGHTKQSLLVLIEKTKRDTALAGAGVISAAQQVEKLQENIEQWFNDAMDRVGGWYKRWTQRILLGVAVILVLFSNADAFMLVKRFSRDNALRASVVAAAENAIQNGAGDQGSAATKNLLNEANKLTLPLGWIANPDDPYKGEQIPVCTPLGWSCAVGWLVKLVGLLISVIAVQLGAPFWFDTLSKFVNIRSAGTPPGQTVKSGPQPQPARG